MVKTKTKKPAAAKKPGAAVLFAIFDGLLRACIPPKTARPPIIRKRIDQLRRGQLDALLAATTKRQTGPPGTERNGLTGAAARRLTARKIESNLRNDSLRSAKRVADQDSSSRPSMAAVSNKLTD